MNILVTGNQIRAMVEDVYGIRIRQPLLSLPSGVHGRAWLGNGDDGDWVVKVSDPRSVPRQKLLAQCELFAFLISRGIQTPEVRVARDGNQVSTVDAAKTRWPVTVMRHHQLRRLAAGSVTTEELQYVAAQVAQLHSTMEDYPSKGAIIADREKSKNEGGRQDAGCYYDLIKSPLARSFSALELAWLRAVDTALVECLDARFPDPASLTQAVLHGDLSFEHVSLLLNGEVYFFDLGDMNWGPVAHELAQFLRGFRDAPISATRWTDLRHWLLSGYRQHNTLTAAVEVAIEVLMLNRFVALAKYIIELNADTASTNAAEAIENAYRLAEALLSGS